MTRQFQLTTEDLTEYERFLLNALITQEEAALGRPLSFRRRQQLAEEAVAQHARAVKQKKPRKTPHGRPRKVTGTKDAEPEAKEDFQWRKPVSSRLLPPR
ncbi:DUF3811 domain-containing protein [Enterobacter asburiae]